MQNPEQGSPGRNTSDVVRLPVGAAERRSAAAVGRERYGRMTWMAPAVVVGAIAGAWALRTLFAPAAASAQQPAAPVPAGPPAPAMARAAGPEPAKPVARDVARVNNVVIRRLELGELAVRRFGKDMLESIVSRKLIEQACQRAGIVIPPKEVDEEIDRIAKRFNLPKDQYIKVLSEERNVSYERYARDIVWPTLALRRLAAAQLVVTPEEMTRAYESTYGAAVQVRWIVLDDAKEAETVRAKAVAAPDQFPRIAIDHSKDYASASAGGLIQPIRRHVGFVEVEKVAFTLQEGQVSDVFQVGKQFVVLKCEKHVAARNVDPAQANPILEEAIKERKIRQAGQDVFKQIKEQAVVVTIFTNPEMAKNTPDLAATVNGEPIPLSELAEETIARYGKDLLEAMISRKLLEQELLKRNIPMGQPDIDQELGHAARRAGFMQGEVPDVAKLVTTVCTEKNLEADAYVNEIVWPITALKKLTAGKFTVDQDDMQRGFEANFGEKMMCRAIVLDNQRRAREVWEMARRNPTIENFEMLAGQYSMDPSTRGMNGVIPPIHKHCGEPLLEKEAFRLNPGELSSVLQLDQKYVILYCAGRTKPVAASIEEEGVKQAIYEDIFEKKQRVAMNEEMEAIRESATIDNFLAGTTQRPGKSALDPNRPGAPGGPNDGVKPGELTLPAGTPFMGNPLPPQGGKPAGPAAAVPGAPRR